MKNNITEETLTGLSLLLKKRELSARELTEAYLQRIRLIEPQIHAFISVCSEYALEAAECSDRRRTENKELSVLDGIPFSVKDNICTKGIATTCGSRMLKNFIPPYSATVFKNLTENGAVLLGKTNLDEFGMGNTTEYSAFFPTANPLDISRVPGGSSGGSAASVASREAVFSLGSDTGGSVRQPSAYCGVVGLCPTYGAFSRFGLTSFASSLDRIGLMAKTAGELRLLLPFILGRDHLDATSVTYCKPLNNAPRNPENTVIGIADEYFSCGLSKEVKSSVINALKIFERLGYRTERITIPSFKYALPAYYIISSAEASSNLARYDGVRFGHRTSAPVNSIDELYRMSRSEGFGDEVKRRIMLGTFVLSAKGENYYQNALKARAKLRDDFETGFKKCDLIIAPVSPNIPCKLGTKTSPLETYLEDSCTVPSSLAGLPALSLPCGKASEGLPIGMQLIGKQFSEYLLLDIAERFENEISAHAE